MTVLIANMPPESRPKRESDGGWDRPVLPGNARRGSTDEFIGAFNSQHRELRVVEAVS